MQGSARRGMAYGALMSGWGKSGRRHGDYFPEDVEPLYVRPCDAIENLPRLAEKMGCSASRSVSELDRMLHEEPHSAI